MSRVYFVKSVIFDMDGVITNTMPDHYLAWREILQQAGIRATHLDIYSREGQPGLHSLKEIFRQYGKKFDKIFAKELLKNKEEIFKKIARARFINGSRAFVKSLYRQKFRLALVTGTSRREVHRILPKNLYNLFEVIITGNDVKHGKPHPEPYLKALKGLNLKSSQSVVIENAPFGIQSARRAGIRCLALETSLPSSYLKEASFIFKSIKDMTNQINFVYAH